MSQSRSASLIAAFRSMGHWMRWVGGAPWASLRSLAVMGAPFPGANGLMTICSIGTAFSLARNRDLSTAFFNSRIFPGQWWEPSWARAASEKPGKYSQPNSRHILRAKCSASSKTSSSLSLKGGKCTTSKLSLSRRSQRNCPRSASAGRSTLVAPTRRTSTCRVF